MKYSQIYLSTDVKFEKDFLYNFTSEFTFTPNNFDHQIATKPIYCMDRIIGDFEIIYFVGGTGYITIDKREYVCKAGDMILIPPFTLHSIWTTAPDLHNNYWIHFDVSPFYRQDEFYRIMLNGKESKIYLGHNSGHNTTHNARHNEGYDAGHNSGHNTIHNARHDEGYDAGHNSGHNSGYNTIHNAGYDAGHNTTHNEGHNSGHNTTLNTGCNEKLLELYEMLEIEMKNKHIGYWTFFRTILMQIITLVLRYSYEESISSETVSLETVNKEFHSGINLPIFHEKSASVVKDRSIVEKSMDYINMNISKSINISDLCKYIHVSESCLFKAYMKTIKMPPNKVIQLLKIKRAEQIMKTSSKSIKEISDMLGFSSPYYFSSVFKKIYNVPPKEYLGKINY